MYPWMSVGDMPKKIGVTKIVLTVHHIDSDKQNSEKQNLIALCQRCHCRLDLYKHMRKAKETRFKKKTMQSYMPLSIL